MTKSEKIIEALKAFIEGEKVKITTVTKEKTPDGPLHTFKENNLTIDEIIKENNEYPRH